MGLMTAAALRPAKPVPSPAPIPARKVTMIVSNKCIFQSHPFVIKKFIFKLFEFEGIIPLEEENVKGNKIVSAAKTLEKKR